MASVTVTTAWSDPTGSLTADQAYIVQNKGSGVLQFFEGSSFDAAANDLDGVLLVPLHDGGSGSSDFRWSYDSSNQVRLRMTGGIPGTTDLVEFAPAA